MSNRARRLVLTLSLCSLTSLSCSPFGPPPDSGDVLFQATYLTAILKLPARFDSTKTYPLLVALHGNGGTAEGLAPYFSSVAGDSVLVAVPQGEYAKTTGGYSWFFLTSDRTLWEEYDTRSVDHLTELIGAIGSRYRTGKVFILGFSQGASLAYMTGLRNPSLVAGVLAVSGYMPEIDQVGSIIHAQQIQDAKNVKLFIARGTSDALVTRPEFTSQVDFFTSSGYSVTSYEFEGGHQLTNELLTQARLFIKANLGS